MLHVKNALLPQPALSAIFQFSIALMLSTMPSITALSENQTNIEAWLAKAPLPPPFAAGPTKAAWIEMLSREDKGEYVREKFQFDNAAGSIVPGYALLPKQVTNKAPAILYCHWHGGEYEIGKEELFQSKHMPEAPGPALAKRGYVVLGIDAYCFGERNGQGPGIEKGSAGELSASKFNLWIGRTLWGMIVRDDLMALDYLASRPDVDSKRIGVMGMSMGATRSWWLMALDERIKTGVPICCLTRYQNLIRRDLLKAHGIYYYVPNVLNHFDTEAIVALIAPRPVLFLDGDQDGTSPVDGIHDIEAAVRPVYRLYDQETAFQNIVYEHQGHLYTPEMWERTLAWFDTHLKKSR